MFPILSELAARSPEVPLFTAFAAGTAASLGLCAVVRLPIVLAYVAASAGSKRHGVILSILFTLGLVAGTVLLGLAATPTEEGLRRILCLTRYAFWALGAGLLIAGVCLSGLINPHLLPARAQQAARRLVHAGSPGALLLGCAFGLLQTPSCPSCGAAVQNLLAAGAERTTFQGLLLFGCFAAGQSLVVLAVGLLTSFGKPTVVLWLRTYMCSVEQRMQLLAGNVLMVLGVYFLIVS